MEVSKNSLYIPKIKEIKDWYDKLKEYRYGLEDHETLDTFQADMRAGAVIKKDYGIFYLTNLHDPIGNAYGHCYFWDRRTKGRDQDLQEMLEQALTIFMLHRITVMIPTINGITARWLQKNGMELEGYLKAYMTYHKQFYDMYIFAYYSKQLRKHIDNMIDNKGNTISRDRDKKDLVETPG